MSLLLLRTLAKVIDSLTATVATTDYARGCWLGIDCGNDAVCF